MTTMQDSKFGEYLYLTPRVPQGLAAAVEGLTREVLRHRPENIYAFAARHFENLLRLREQYDDEPSSSDKQNKKLEDDANEATKERRDESKDANDQANQSGWSLNETAKVLEKHRSIFGDSGQKVSTERIRELANEPVLGSTDKICRDGSPKRKLEQENAGSSRRKECPRVSHEAPKNGVRNAPKILSQIPIAKDIKTELRRNRISSRERKKIVACEYTRETIIERSSRKSFEKTRKSYEVRSERRSCRTEDSASRRRTEAAKSRANSQEDNKLSRAGSMDGVKNYVVQNLVGMTSLDELQSPSYVEKVQEVIDETSSVIREKVEALKSGVANAARANRANKEASTSGEDRSRSSSKSGGRSREPRRSSKSARDSSPDRDASEASESKSSLPAVLGARPPSSKSTSRSVSSRSDSDAALTLPPISPESAKSPKVKEDLVLPVLPVLSPPRTAPPAEDAKDATSSYPNIDEDPRVAGQTAGSLEDKVPGEESLVPLQDGANDEVQENLALSEEETDERAMESADKFQESSDGKRAISAEGVVEESVADAKPTKAPTDFLQVGEEQFHDSLNVTPEPFDDKGQRPDSLENSLAEDNRSAGSSGHATPLETLKDKLLEIEQVQKRIEDVLDEGELVGKADQAIAGSKMEDKLVEIQESERRIEQILDSQSTSETLSSDIKNKLRELEEAERRIESIFNGEPMQECSNETLVPAINVEDSVAATSENEDKSQVASEEQPRAMPTTTDHLSLPTASEENAENAEAARAVSPHSYILTEGSPYEIPDSVTTVIIPERTPSPDSETPRAEGLQVPTGENQESCSINDAFGEAVLQTAEHSEPSTVDIEYIRGIKASHDMIVSRDNLDRIKEERDEAEVVDSEDERVLRVVTSSLEDILEREEAEHAEIGKLEANARITDNSLESPPRSAESSNELKETPATTDRSSVSLEPIAPPPVPELNLDSLADLTLSSLNPTEKDSTSSPASFKKEDGADTRQLEKPDDQRLPTDTIDDAAQNDPAPTAESQCTIATASIETNGRQSDADRHDDNREKKPYHIYVPEPSTSKDATSSTETSTFMSAATKIQAGVRGFLTRRRLQSTQKRSSTLDSVPSIQESFIVETSVGLMPIMETTSMSEAKAKKKLRREDAVQRTTLSVENAFAENQLQHTGESHDCIPLPLFDAEALSMKSVKERERDRAKEKASEVELLLEKILLGHAAASKFAARPKLVDVVLLPADAELQSEYLNFITSVEDVFSDIPETPKGLIIEEITSLEEASKLDATAEQQVGKPNDAEEAPASISTSEEPLSINIEDVLGLGEEDEPSRKPSRLNVKLNSVDQLRSSSVSQDSPVSDERTRSPVTMMQIAPKSVDEKSEENPT